VDQGTVFDDDVKVIGTRMDTKKYNKDITSTRKRGHPRKNVERSNTDTQKEPKLHKILINRCKANVVGYPIQANTIDFLIDKS
jgi:hypothetical protein